MQKTLEFLAGSLHLLYLLSIIDFIRYRGNSGRDYYLRISWDWPMVEVIWVILKLRGAPWYQWHFDYQPPFYRSLRHTNDVRIPKYQRILSLRKLFYLILVIRLLFKRTEALRVASGILCCFLHSLLEIALSELFALCEPALDALPQDDDKVDCDVEENGEDHCPAHVVLEVRAGVHVPCEQQGRVGQR